MRLIHLGYLAAAVFLLVTGGIVEANAAKLSTNVRCGKGHSLQTALDKHTAPGTVLTISGKCSENVIVESDDITLDGGGSGEVDGVVATEGTITVDGRHVTIKGLKVTGGSNGIWVRNGGSVVLSNDEVSGASDVGVLLGESAYGRLINNHVYDSGSSGVAVSGGSGADLTGNEINNNGVNGIVVSGGTAHLDGNDIHDDASDELLLTTGRIDLSQFGAPNTITAVTTAATSPQAILCAQFGGMRVWKSQNVTGLVVAVPGTCSISYVPGVNPL